MQYKYRLVWLIAISTLVRIILASTQEFGNVEAYYWVLATKLQWNYFDHPPMVAWLIRLTTGNLLIHSELFVRLGAIIAAAICTWLIFKIGCLLASERAGWYMSILYTTSIYSGINIATFILPDSPQMVFWLSSLYFLFKILRVTPGEPKYNLYWCLFGILSGFCIMSKVHGTFLWIGALLYFLIYARDTFRHRAIYIAMAITFLIVLPIIIWNFGNDFITYKFQGERISLSGASINLSRFAKQLVDIVFSTGPVHVFLIGMGIYQATRGKLNLDKSSLRVLLLCSLPLIIILFVISFFREVLPHWPGPALSALVILPGIYLSSASLTSVKLPRIFKFTLIYAALVCAMDAVFIRCIPGTLSAEKQGMKTGTDDVTLDMYGWALAATKFDSLYKDDVHKKIMPATAPIIVTHWIPAAHVEYYIASVAGVQTFGLGQVYDLHQYSWLNKTKRPLLAGDDAYYIIPSNLFTYKTFNGVLKNFKSYDFALVFPEYRLGLVCKVYYVVRLRGYKGSAY